MRFHEQQVIYIESPLLVSLTSLNPGLWQAVEESFQELEFTPDFPALWYYAAFLSVLSSSPPLQSAIQNKWVPDVSQSPYPNLARDAGVLLLFLAQSHHLSVSDKQILSQTDTSVIGHTALVWRYNSFGHHTDASALCMYDITSMMAHSCAPSGVWQFGHDDSFCLRARVALKRGDEISISYLGEDDLVKSASIRRAKTNGWLFACACTRCNDQMLDFSRGLRCPTCLVGSVFFHSVSVEICSACTACGSHMDESEKEHRLALESDYADRVAVTDKSDFEDVYTVYKQSMNLFTNQHWVPYTLETYLGDFLKTQSVSLTETSGRDGQSTVVQRTHFLHNRIQFLKITYPLPNYTLANLWEELGDCYLTLGAKEQAAESFDSAYWIYVILLGHDHPSAEAVYAKHEACLARE